MKAAEQGRQLSEMTLEEMDKLWDEAKEKEGKGQCCRFSISSTRAGECP